jgi:23S rRNA (adenine2503-C2)-methyltransferase
LPWVFLFNADLRLMGKVKICGCTVEEIYDFISPSGFSMNHALKISNSVYKKSASSFLEINDIPKNLKAQLESDASTGLFPPEANEVSADGAVKYLFVNENGLRFEAVFIPETKRNTVCVSSQSGCRMSCSFCVTGKYGFHGNLTAGEIINQVISIPEARKITHVVFMGMGEPMDNYDNVLKATKILTAQWGMALSPRNVTVSSVGITPRIEKFLEQSGCNLTISLFSPFSGERAEVMPVEHKYPVHEVIGIMKSFPLRKKRRLTLSYMMIRDHNDSDSHLQGLKELLAGSGIRVNLLPYHSHEDDPYASSTEEKLQYFKHELVMSGISASVRKSRGKDISAACGLLAAGRTSK